MENYLPCSKNLFFQIFSLTLMLLADNLANAKWCQKPANWLKTWYMGTHLRVLCKWYPMNTAPTWQGLDGFQNCLLHCALEESSFSIWRVNLCLDCTNDPTSFDIIIWRSRVIFWSGFVIDNSDNNSHSNISLKHCFIIQIFSYGIRRCFSLGTLPSSFISTVKPRFSINMAVKSDDNQNSKIQFFCLFSKVKWTWGQLGLVSMFSGFMIVNMAVKSHDNQNSKFDINFCFENCFVGYD